MEPLRVYLDTSVFGGCFDEQFAEGSKRIFRWVRQGRLRVLVSRVITRELEHAPERVRRVFDDLPDDAVEVVEEDERSDELVDAYIQAGIVGERWVDDATHVALAVIAEADAVISWNFRHIVRLDRIKAYNTVGQAFGYRPLTILSPIEVINGDENEQDVRLR